MSGQRAGRNSLHVFPALLRGCSRPVVCLLVDIIRGLSHGTWLDDEEMRIFIANILKTAAASR